MLPWKDHEHQVCHLGETIYKNTESGDWNMNEKKFREASSCDWAMQVMKIHSDRKDILEVEFAGKEGTGRCWTPTTRHRHVHLWRRTHLQQQTSVKESNHLATTLQNNRLVHLPLSRRYLKLMCNSDIQKNVNERFAAVKKTPGNDVMMSSFISEESENQPELDPRKILM